MFSTGFGLPKGLLETVGKTLDAANAQDRVYAKLLEDFGVTTPNELSEERQDEFLTKGIDLLGEGHAMVHSLKKRIAERASHATVTAAAEKIANHRAPEAPKKKVNEGTASDKPIADMSRGGGKTDHQKDVEKAMRSEESIEEASNEAPGIPHLDEEIDLSEEQIAEAGDKVTAFMKGFDAEKHEVMYNGKKHKIVTKSKVADHKEKGWKIRRTVSGLSKGLAEEPVEEAKKLAGYKGPMKMVTVKKPKTDAGKDAKKGGGGVFKLPARKYDPAKHDLAESRRVSIVREAMGKKTLKKEEDDEDYNKSGKTLTGQARDKVELDTKMKDNTQTGGSQVKSGTT